MADGPHRKVANSVVALGSAAVLAVYAAGYLRTRTAADRFALQAAERRPLNPVSSARGPSGVSAGIPPGTPLATSIPGGRPLVSRGPSVSDAVAPRRPRGTAQREHRQPRVPRPDVSPTVGEGSAEPVAPAPSAEPPAPVVTTPAVPASEPVSASARSTYKDGTYFGWGTSRHGDIQAAVLIEGGRIASASIAQCLTRYSCSVIAALPPEVAQRQSPEVDYISGATQSTNAFYYAVVDALSKAR